jgi:hypothetical protein
MVAEPAFESWERRAVCLRRERWEMLIGSHEWPILGMYQSGRKFFNLLEPREIGEIVFLPATYVCEDGPDDTNAGTATR